MSKLAPMIATTAITATPTKTMRLGRGSGIRPRLNGSSTKYQLSGGDRNGEDRQRGGLRCGENVERPDEIQAAEDQDRPVPEVERVADLAQEPDRRETQQNAGARGLRAGSDKEHARERGHDGCSARIRRQLRVDHEGCRDQAEQRGPAGEAEHAAEDGADPAGQDGRGAHHDCQQAAGGELPGASRQHVEGRRRVVVRHVEAGQERGHDDHRECDRRARAEATSRQRRP